MSRGHHWPQICGKNVTPIDGGSASRDPHSTEFAPDSLCPPPTPFYHKRKLSLRGGTPSRPRLAPPLAHSLAPPLAHHSPSSPPSSPSHHSPPPRSLVQRLAHPPTLHSLTSTPLSLAPHSLSPRAPLALSSSPHSPSSRPLSSGCSTRANSLHSPDEDFSI